MNVAYDRDSLSIKESIFFREQSHPANSVLHEEKIKIYDICKYIDARNWKCGPFQMQDGTLVKNEKLRFSAKKADYDAKAQSQLCLKDKLTPVTPTNSNKSQAKDSNTLSTAVSVDRTAASIESNSTQPPAEKPANHSIESTKALNTFLAQLSTSIRTNLNFSQNTEVKWESEVEVNLSEDGKIGVYHLLKSSGNPAWDAAVLKAISVTQAPVPKSDIKIPKKVVFSFSSRE